MKCSKNSSLGRVSLWSGGENTELVGREPVLNQVLALIHPSFMNCESHFSKPAF